jgi:AcrR family transcriptional regulator
MAQRPKEDVRARIVAAAEELFAEEGYAAVGMARVAERASVSTGNVYRYFSGKEALFDEVLPDELVARVVRLTRGKIESLGDERDPRRMSSDAPYHVLSREVVELCVESRARMVILFGRAGGTRHEGFAEGLAVRLAEDALGYAKRAYPSLVVNPQLRPTLRRIYAAFFSQLTEALSSVRTRAEVELVLAMHTQHHRGGLSHLFSTLAEHASRVVERPALVPEPVEEVVHADCHVVTPPSALPRARRPRAAESDRGARAAVALAADPPRRTRRRR